MPGYTQDFLELRTAKAWGLTPPQWRLHSVDDRALMLAFELFNNTRDNYRDWWRRNERKSDGKKPNPYQMMKMQMGIE